MKQKELKKLADAAKDPEKRKELQEKMKALAKEKQAKAQEMTSAARKRADAAAKSDKACSPYLLPPHRRPLSKLPSPSCHAPLSHAACWAASLTCYAAQHLGFTSSMSNPPMLIRPFTWALAGNWLLEQAQRQAQRPEGPAAHGHQQGKAEEPYGRPQGEV